TGANSYNITAAIPATSADGPGGVVPVFTPSSGSPTVSVTLPAHGQAIGATFQFPIPTTVGGIVIQGVYTIVDVPDADHFTISGNVEATDSTPVSMNGGDAQLLYYIGL